MQAFVRPVKGDPIAVSPETATLHAGLPRLDGSGPENASSEAMELLSRPERRDPLSFAATDLVRDLAGERPVVAVLPDAAWLVGSLLPDGLTRAILSGRKANAPAP